MKALVYDSNEKSPNPVQVLTGLIHWAASDSQTIETKTLTIESVDWDPDTHKLAIYTTAGLYIILSDDEFEKIYQVYVDEEGENEDDEGE